MIFVKRKDNENPSSLVYRFSKKVQQSGLIKEAKKRRFHKRKVNDTKRHLAAIFRSEKKKERERLRKLGLL